jgi:hypothetical protein
VLLISFISSAGRATQARAQQEIVTCGANTRDGSMTSLVIPGTVVYFYHSIINCPFEVPPPPAMSTTVWLEHLDYQANPSAPFGVWVRTSLIPDAEDVVAGEWVSEVFQQRYVPALDGLNCFRDFTLFTVWNPIPLLPSFVTTTSNGVCF